MKTVLSLATLLLSLWLLPLAFADTPTTAPASAPSTQPAKIKILVISGTSTAHTRFYKLFKDNPDFDITEIAEGKNSTNGGDPSVYSRPDILSYNLLFLYDYQPKISDTGKKAFLALLDHGTGIIVFHDGLLSYQDWPDYYHIAGGSYLLDNKTLDGQKLPPSDVGRNVIVNVSITDKTHPITQGLSDFTFKDEIYRKVPNTSDIHVLCSAEDKPLIWTRQEKSSRIFTCIIGHGTPTWSNPTFQQLLKNAVYWTAKPN